MLRTLSAAVLLSSTLLALGAPAGATPAGDPGEGYASKSECSCETCELYRADVETVVRRIAAGDVPGESCPGTSEAKACAMRAHPAMFFGTLLGSRPSDLDTVMDLVQTRFTDSKTAEEERSRLLDVLSFFPAKANEKVTLALWKSSPRSFRTAHLAAFASGGAYGSASGGPEPIVAALRSRARTDVVAAAWFGLRGDACGKAALESTVRKLDPAKGVVVEPAVAALGLARIDDGKALVRVRQSLRDAALASLDRGDVEAARNLALSAELIGKYRDAGARAEIGWLQASLEVHCQERAEEITTSDAVFQLLESLRI